MKILILSDSHQASLDSFDFTKYDAIIHCGDYGNSIPTLIQNKIYFVRGNCDTFGEDTLLFELFEKKVFVTHGYVENVKFGLERLIYKSLEREASITFFGHTHQQTCFMEEGILFINPGSFPRSYVEMTEEEIFLYQDHTIKTIQYRW